MTIYQKDFKNNIESKVIYIYNIDKPEVDRTRKIHYIIYSEKDKKYNCASDDYNKIAKLIYERKVCAYSGQLKQDKNGYILDDVGFVAPFIKEGQYYLTTIRDDIKENNLVNLFEYYKV